mgnify:CR=1 FL=1
MGEVIRRRFARFADEEEPVEDKVADMSGTVTIAYGDDSSQFVANGAPGARLVGGECAGAEPQRAQRDEYFLH